MLFILPLLPGEAAPKAAERYFDKEIVRMDKAKRKAIIAGNWKMNKTATEAAKLVDELIPPSRMLPVRSLSAPPTPIWSRCGKDQGHQHPCGR